MNTKAQETALNLLNTAEVAGTIELLTYLSYVQDATREESRHDQIRVLNKALTAYRLCKEALIDFGIELPNDALSATETLPTMDAVLEGLSQWRDLMAEARENVRSSTLESIDDATSSAANFRQTLAADLLASSYNRTAMPQVLEVAEQYTKLKTGRASLAKNLESAKQKATTNVAQSLLRSAEYFLQELDDSIRQTKNEIDAYKKTLEENLTKDENQAVDIGALLEMSLDGLFQSIGESLFGVNQGRISTMATNASLGADELSTANRLLEEAERAIASTPAEAVNTDKIDPILLMDSPSTDDGDA